MEPWSRRLIYLVFFLSGVAALIYEISWSRQLGLLFGHTVHAASVVLGSYFAGMAVGYAIGAWVCGRWSARFNPLVGYALAEAVVALWAFMIPVILRWSESPTFAALLSHDSNFWQISSRACFSFLLLMPATISLGITLPMMAAWLATDNGTANQENASRISNAYALNTAGALVGVTIATLWLIINCGVCGSSYLAAALSLVCAALSVSISRFEKRRCGVNDPGDHSEPSSITMLHRTASSAAAHPLAAMEPLEAMATGSRTALLWRLRLAAVVTGFTTLALQVLYTRMFSLVFHNSTYTFGIVVAVFLLSLALGAAFAARLIANGNLKKMQQRVGLTLAASAIYIVLSVRIFVTITDLDYFRFGNSFVSYMTGATGLVLLVVGPAVLLAGVALPLVWQIAGRMDQNAGRVVGQLTSANTVSAAIGAIVGSFVLLPLVGLWAAFVCVSLLQLSMGVVFLKERLCWRRIVTFGGMWTVLAVITLISPTESGNARRGGERTIRRWNSPYGWIDLVRSGRDEVYKIRQNLHYRFGKTGSNAREYRQAHLPLLLHKNPQDVLFLGLGTGLTAGAAVPHQEVKNIVAVELIPEVVQAVAELGKYNFNIVSHEKSEVVCDDGRHYLLANDREFDVIVSDLFVPWESESGYLYTVEHYQVAARRLKEGGLFCQWLPLYQVGENEFEAIANSFATVFPSVTLWWGKLSGSRGPVIAMIGHSGPVELNPDQMNQRIARLRQSIAPDPSIAHADLVVDHYVGDWILAPAKGTRLLNRDEYPVVELSTPVSNRDRKLISGAVFEDYYRRILSTLPMDSLMIDGNKIATPGQHKSRQGLLLFGGRPATDAQ